MLCPASLTVYREHRAAQGRVSVGRHPQGQTDGRKEKDMLAKEKLEPACAEEDVYIGGREG